MSSYLVQDFFKISKNLEQRNFFGGTLGKFFPIDTNLFEVLSISFNDLRVVKEARKHCFIDTLMHIKIHKCVY